MKKMDLFTMNEMTLNSINALFFLFEKKIEFGKRNSIALAYIFDMP